MGHLLNDQTMSNTVRFVKGTSSMYQDGFALVGYITSWHMILHVQNTVIQNTRLMHQEWYDIDIDIEWIDVELHLFLT